MRSLCLKTAILTAVTFSSAYANGSSYLLPDGLNRAPAVTLHCVSAGGGAVACGTPANPLSVLSTPDANTAANQMNEVAAEQSSAQALGGIGDPAFTGGQGSLVSLLKGVWSALNGGIVVTPSGGTLVSRTVALPAQQSLTVFPANATRRYLSFQVPQSTYVWINLMGGVAAPNAADCAYFGPGTFYESGTFVNRGVITVYAPVAVTFSAWEG